jgi:hypothetical protein
MNENHEPQDAAFELCAAHARDLVALGMKAYGLFPALEAAIAEPAALQSARREVAALVDFMTWQELSVEDAGLHRALAGSLALSPPGPGESLRAWNAAVQAALPSRTACKMLCVRFPEWCAATAPTARAAFIEALTAAAPYVNELGDRGVAVLREGVEAAVAAGCADGYVGFLKTYREADAAIVLGAAKTARAAVDAGATDLLPALAAAVSMDELMESRDACRLLPAMGNLLPAFVKDSTALTAPLLRAVLHTAQASPSSAYGLCRGLLKARSVVPDSCKAAYVETLSGLLHAAGPRMAGFVVRKLPKLFRDLPEGRAAELAQAAARIARDYGTAAAEEFLAQRTPAAARFVRKLRRPA